MGTTVVGYVWLFVDELCCFCKRAEIQCIPLLTQLINTTSTSVGTVVNVTCKEKQAMSDKRETASIVSICDSFGRWQPSVPDCVGRYINKF